MKPVSFLTMIILALALIGCNLTASTTSPTTIPTIAPTLAFNQPTATQPAIPTFVPTAAAFTATPAASEQDVLSRAAQVVASLKNKDMVALAAFVSPQMGLRFSLYASVKDSDLVFPADKLAGLLNDDTVYTWGAYSGSGEAISLTFAGYYAQFVYDVDFANAPQVSVNHRLGVSTSMDNAAKFYPGAMIVEYHFPELDPNMQGMDWRSLRLVFVEENGTWYLVGIIHDQWTT